MEFAHPPHVCVDFLQVLCDFLPHPKDANVRFTGMSKLSQSGCGLLFMSVPYNGVASCPRLGLTLHPELLGQALATLNPDLE